MMHPSPDVGLSIGRGFLNGDDQHENQICILLDCKNVINYENINTNIYTMIIFHAILK